MEIQFKQVTVEVTTSDDEVILITGKTQEIIKAINAIEAKPNPANFIQNQFTGEYTVSLNYFTELNSEESAYKLNRVKVFG